MEQQYHLKKVKTFNGMEGGGYEADVYLGKKKIAHAFNEGSGGCDHLHFFDRADRAPFEAFVVAWYETSTAKTEWQKLTEQYGGDPNASNDFKMESWIGSIIDRMEEEKWLKRNSKTKTPFRLVGDDPGNWRTVNAPISAEVATWIRNKYGDQVETIYGEASLQSSAHVAPPPACATKVPSAAYNF